MADDPFKSIIYRVLRTNPTTLPEVERMDLIVEAYRWTIGDIPIETVELASREAVRRATCTVPSAGQIYQECIRLQG